MVGGAQFLEMSYYFFGIFEAACELGEVSGNTLAIIGAQNSSKSSYYVAAELPPPFFTKGQRAPYPPYRVLSDQLAQPQTALTIK